MEYKASHKYARISARKVRPVADLVRGQNVNRALDILEFQPRRGAFFFKKLIRSAVANATTAEARVNQLVVSQIYVNDGPLLHRPLGRFVARGRWHPIRKRTSHLHVVLADPGGDDGTAKEAAAQDDTQPEAGGDN